MPEKPNAPAVLRNREAILDVIRNELQGCESVLEIGSGTGQHAVFFARNMPWLVWQTSDMQENHDGIHAWLEEADLENILEPLELDVRKKANLCGSYSAVFSANTAHIMHFSTVQCMFSMVAEVLGNGGKFCLYGPFNLDGTYTSESNREFDASLKQVDPGMGIRNLEDLDDIGISHGLARESLYAMPANNMLAVWTKQSL